MFTLGPIKLPLKALPYLQHVKQIIFYVKTQSTNSTSCMVGKSGETKLNQKVRQHYE
uniref:Uncharacterized protein n=1 Tax=Rhizophora mucronata TaxID=61149 RepID=A0A2P2PN20_RHIMU